MAIEKDKDKIKKADANLQLYSSDEYRAKAQKWVEIRLICTKLIKVLAYVIPAVATIVEGLSIILGK